MVLAEANLGLLLSYCSIEGVNLELIESHACFLDHFLVCSFVNDKYKSVTFLNSLDSGLTGEWVLDGGQHIESVFVVDSSQENIWCLTCGLLKVLFFPDL